MRCASLWFDTVLLLQVIDVAFIFLPLSHLASRLATVNDDSPTALGVVGASRRLASRVVVVRLRGDRGCCRLAAANARSRCPVCRAPFSSYLRFDAAGSHAADAPHIS